MTRPRILSRLSPLALFLPLTGCPDEAQQAALQAFCDSYVTYRDSDGDGFGTLDASHAGCDVPEGFVPEAGDCDDDNPDVHPGGSGDECADQLDYDCDGELPELVDWYVDADGDGFGDEDAVEGLCEVPASGYAETGGDCDDSNADVRPDSELEECTDRIDYNCDAMLGVDADGDGAASCEDCDDGNPDIHPGAYEVCGNDVDENCDAEVVEFCSGSGFSVGNSHGCLASDDLGGTWCFGVDNNQTVYSPNCYSQSLLDGEHTNSAVFMSAGNDNTCWEGVEGIECWGEVEEWGATPAASAFPPAGFTDHTTEGLYGIAIGADHACALYDTVDAKGYLVCWAANATAAVTGVPTDGDDDAPEARSGYLKVSSSNFGSCALRPEGVDCWGGGLTDSVPGDFADFASGQYHACALGTDGTLNCFGWDGTGAVSGPNAYEGDILDMDVGGTATCLLTGEGGVECWGDPGVASDAPTATGFTELEMGGGFACVLDAGLNLTCWGSYSDSDSQSPTPFWDETDALECE